MQRTKVSKLLDFIFPISNLSEIITQKTRGVLEQRIDTLEELSRNLGEGKPIEGKTASLVYNKFNRYFDGISDEKFERGEFRILSSILDAPPTGHKSILASSEKLKFALALLDDNWRDSYLPGLIRTFLNSWKSVPVQSLQKLEKLINLKASKYEGKQSTINVFKANKKYFNTKDGDIKLGKYLAGQKKSILSVTKMLSIPDEWFKYYYFSSVIITYFENLKKDLFVEFIEKDLDEILKRHYFSFLTKQVLVSRIIIRTNNNPEFEDLQNLIRDTAFKHVGDPEDNIKWNPQVGATEQDKEDIETARKILNDWISQQFIQVFFEKCINEPRRKKFWKEVAEKNSMSFRIIGSRDTKNMLLKIEKINPFVDSRFNITAKDSDESAIVMYINDYMLIEFSDENKAFYAYKMDSPYKPKITKLDSIRDLIDGSMPFILKAGYIENDEGRLKHRDGNERWERNFIVVLKELVKIK